MSEMLPSAVIVTGDCLVGVLAGDLSLAVVEGVVVVAGSAGRSRFRMGSERLSPSVGQDLTVPFPLPLPFPFALCY